MFSEPTKSESVFDASDSTQNSSRTSKNEDATISTPQRKKKRTPRQKVFSEPKQNPDKITSLTAEASLAHCAASPIRNKVWLILHKSYCHFILFLPIQTTVVPFLELSSQINYKMKKTINDISEIWAVRFGVMFGIHHSFYLKWSHYSVFIMDLLVFF